MPNAKHSPSEVIFVSESRAVAEALIGALDLKHCFALPTRTGERPSPRPLSAREIDAMDQLAPGKSNKEVAAALGVAEQAAKNHVARVMRKLGVRSRHDAARMALAQLRGQAA